jgi:hypothetical protein
MDGARLRALSDSAGRAPKPRRDSKRPARLVALSGVCAWLGYLAWRADSIVPSIVCHIAVNTLGFGLGFAYSVLKRPHSDAPLGTWGALGWAAVALVLVLAGVVRAEKRARSG